MDKKLREAINRTKGRPMTVAELNAQRVSFVYGNAPKEDKGTKAAVRRSLSRAEFHPA